MVEDVLRQSTVNHLVPVVCVHIRGVSAIHRAGLEGCLQFRGLDWRGLGRGVSAIRGSGLEGYMQFRGLD